MADADVNSMPLGVSRNRMKSLPKDVKDSALGSIRSIAVREDTFSDADFHVENPLDSREASIQTATLIRI